ncbi:hypothetical protein HMPREF1109_0538 [Streptococcus intermedius SK54 = ATCC 27335]|nr:hypothetical protein HMPREF1109_0538 [Streptococcus intermedius SK54 = ATCC 27335]EPH02201.1 hypothetical protein HMPREF1654_01830 [Streptococcus intermedius SK54 = ATCC 27335]BAM23917.1 hypothetical protein SCIM_1263 [Streptococcus intermedius JTH08]SQH52397.1 Uncharacterised protein [Streptococcus intermedius]
MSKFLFFSLYYTSFTPLWISILFIDIKSCIECSQSLGTEKYSIFVIVFLWIVSLIAVLLRFSSDEKEGTSIFVLKNIQEEKSITSEYLLSYILPLFAFDFTKWDSMVLFLVFFTTLGYLCIKHNYFSVNIVLEILNYRIFTCELENEDKILVEKFIISHKNLNVKKGENVYLKSLNNEFKLDIDE